MAPCRDHCRDCVTHIPLVFILTVVGKDDVVVLVINEPLSFLSHSCIFPYIILAYTGAFLKPSSGSRVSWRRELDSVGICIVAPERGDGGSAMRQSQSCRILPCLCLHRCSPYLHLPSEVLKVTVVHHCRLIDGRWLRNADIVEHSADSPSIDIHLSIKSVVQEGIVQTYVQLRFFLPAEIEVHILGVAICDNPFAIIYPV